MGASIHPTAVVDPSAELADGVTVGPLAVVGARVVVGADCEIGAGAHLQGPTRLGARNRVFTNACVGFEPQDLKFKGEDVFLEIGDGNVFREFTTVHRGTGLGGGVTRIGDDNLFMTYSHVGHDAQVGSRTIFVNGATLAGHVEVGDDSTIGAYSAVHQYCRVGRHAYIGGYTVLTMDALPYVKTVGAKPACYGVNVIGLRRKGFEREAVARLRRAMRLLLHEGLPAPAAIERIAAEVGGHPEVDALLEFLATSRRGVVKTLPGKRSGRGGAAGAGGEEGGSGVEGENSDD